MPSLSQMTRAWRRVNEIKDEKTSPAVLKAMALELGALYESIRVLEERLQIQERIENPRSFDEDTELRKQEGGLSTWAVREKMYLNWITKGHPDLVVATLERIRNNDLDRGLSFGELKMLDLAYQKVEEMRGYTRDGCAYLASGPCNKCGKTHSKGVTQ